MRRSAALSAALLMAGCAATGEGPETARPEPDPNPAALVVTVEVLRDIAEDRAEALAARCWLAGPLADGIMLVDRRTGAITVEEDAGPLLAVAFAAPEWGTTEIRLTGPALDAADARARYAADLRRAVGQGEPVC